MALVSLNFESEFLNQNEQVEIILPDKPRGVSMKKFYQEDKKYKVLWLLHGTYGDGTDWLRRTRIELYASEKDMIVVMPSAMNSDYVNWPKFGLGYNFYDFFFKELMPMVQAWFPASPKKEDNFIAGLSMGGEGAAGLGMTHPEKFAAIGCLSFPLINYHVHSDGRYIDEKKIKGNDKRFLNSVENLGGMEEFLRSPYNTWDIYFNTKKKLPKMYFYCGDEDFLWNAYCEFKEAAAGCERKNVFFQEYPGYHHEWRVWDMAIEDFINKCDPDTVGAGNRF
ncbi:MAG: hypothetical protein IKE21_08950 [Erysipelotrichaceae bacterium]|nr:hypothetical protein [Erysipelotrichaceae bacterium]